MSDGQRRLILALDTASATGGVALLRGPEVLGEETWRAGGRQTAEVLPAAARLWGRAGVHPGSLDAVAVSAGPGSYTGLRAGFSLAKGLALASGLPVVAVPTPEAIAYQHRHQSAQLCTVIDAGRGQLYVTLFRLPAGEPAAGAGDGDLRHRPQGGDSVLTPLELGERLAGETAGDLLVCGELYPDLAPALRERAAPGVRLASPADALRRPAFLAEIAGARLDAGTVPDAATLQPVYLRRTP